MFIISGRIINQPTIQMRVEAFILPDRSISISQKSNPELMTREARQFVGDELIRIGNNLKNNIFSNSMGDFKEPCPK